MIFVIDSNEVMAECIAKACGDFEVKVFDNAIIAMNAISEGELPSLIFMDVMLTGPDGFTFLNEMISYVDTAKIPVVIVSEVDYSSDDLSDYGVVGCLDKDKMTPEDVRGYVEKYC